MNVHFKFRPELYTPICKRLRMYHPLSWDFADRPASDLPEFPIAANKVNWNRHA